MHRLPLRFAYRQKKSGVASLRSLPRALQGASRRRARPFWSARGERGATPLWIRADNERSEAAPDNKRAIRLMIGCLMLQKIITPPIADRDTYFLTDLRQHAIPA